MKGCYPSYSLSELEADSHVCRPAQDAARPQAKVHLRLAQKFYFDRLQELKSSIAAYEQRFTTLMSEIAAIKSGSMDKPIKDEIRAVLARKFGKRLLDSWVPDEDAVKQAVEAGPPEAEAEENEGPTTEQGVVDNAEPDLHVVGEAGVEETPAEVSEEDKSMPGESAEVADPTADPPEQAGDVEMAEPDSKDSPAIEVRAATPTAVEATPHSSPPRAARGKRSAASTPASEFFTPPPEDRTEQVSPSKTKEEETAGSSTRASKRKASAPPRGASTAKRSTRRKTSATPAAIEVEPVVETTVETETGPEPEVTGGENDADQAEGSEPPGQAEHVSDEEGTVYVDDQSREVDESEAVEEDQEAEEEEAPPTRGRRGTKRDSAISSRAKKPTSPASSSRHLSPPATKDGTSASPLKSPTPVEDRRSTRRGAVKGRGMRDEVVSKSVREQSAAVESVKEEEEAGEQEKPPTRSTRRTKDNTTPVPDISAPLPDQRKGTRRSSTRAGKSTLCTAHKSRTSG